MVATLGFVELSCQGVGVVLWRRRPSGRSRLIVLAIVSAVVPAANEKTCEPWSR